MASTIVTKNSSTASAVPVTGDLTQGELAVNVTDKKLYTKDSGGTVVKLVGGLGNQEANAVAITGGSINGTTVGATTASTGAFTTLSASSTTTLSGGTANGVAYLNGSKVVTTGSALVFDGSNLGVGTSPLAARVLSVKGRAAFTALANDSQIAIYSDGSTNGIYSTYNSTGSYLPMTFYINDAEQMRLTSTGLGIGTSSPGAKLTVHAGADGDVGFFRGGSTRQVQIGTSSTAGYINTDNGSAGLEIRTQGTARMFVDNSGNLGLGITPSAWATFKAMQIGNGTADTFIAVSGNQGDFGVNAYYNAGWKYQTSSVAASRYEQSSGVHQWFNAPSGTAGNAISFTQAMTLDASGNLLVGTTSSTYGGQLTVRGATVTVASFMNSNFVAATSGTQLNINAGATTGNTNFQMQVNSGGGLAYNDLVLQPNGGNLLVGDTGSVVTTGVLRVKETGSNYIARLQSTGASTPQGLSIYYSAAAPNGTGSPFLYCEDSGALRMSVRSNGGIANYSANDVNLSDHREKTNFAPAGNYLAKICAIPVQTFNYIDQSEDDPGLTLGVVAQDVQAVAPELVMESNWGTEEEPKMRLSIYQTDLQYALMKCIQEQQAIIEQLKADVAALKGN